uniref:Transcription factor bHLH87 n=1 Tax=Anthurium amnicola TaxID=1678845 RepID=A0A1D1ZJ05_9ARAE
MQRKISSRNPNPNKSMQAFHFLRALAWIKHRRFRQYSASGRADFRCSLRIKRAAYASMALAAGPRKAWSRAILCHLRRRAAARSPASRRGDNCKRAKVVKPKTMEDGNQADELRQLVPGGRRMDLCSLLEETGHYIQCLTAQVRLMENIADSMSGQASEIPKVVKDNTKGC